MQKKTTQVRPDIPTKYQSLFRKAAAGNSKACAIKAFCLQCVAYKKSEVITCTAKLCPLYPYRPYAHANPL